ncbi:MAG: hypothetical protein OEY29_14275 [Gammaproteobacteria bacterium]|nr:hypothetical protein [Gammaproteobacteria bacterium]
MTTVNYPSKITQPLVHRVLFRDELLTDIKARQEFSPLIWVSASGGSGKSTLISSFLTKYKRRNIWYQIDDGDSDPATLFHFLKLGAKKLSPKSTKTFPYLSAEYLPGITNFTRQFTDTLSSLLRADGVIVFDNLHLLAEDSILYTLLPVMITAIQPGQSIIVISRQQPPDSFIALQAAQKMSLINEQHLRFNETEWCDLAKLLNYDISDPQSLLQLHKRSDGWISGLLLGQLDSTNIHNKHKSLSASSFAYFAQEVFLKLSRANQQCLLRLSHLPYISQSFALKISNDKNVMVLINEMSSKNQFIIPYEGDKFIFHPLFQEFLQLELKNHFSVKSICRLIHHTAQLLAEDKNYFSAISLFFEADDSDQAITLICEQAGAFIASGQVSQLSQAMRKIPLTRINSTAQLCYINASLLSMGNPEAAINYYSQACDLFLTEGNIASAFESQLAAIKQVNVTLHCFEKLDSLIEKFSALQTSYTIPESLSQKDLISTLMTAYFITDYDREQMNYWIKRCEQEIELNADPAQTAELTIALLMIYFNECNSEKIFNTVSFILPFISKEHLPPFIYLASHFTIVFAWVVGMNIEKGHQLVISLKQFAKQSEITALDAFLLIAQAKFELYRADFKSVNNCLEQLYPLCRGDRNYLSNYYYLQTQKHLFQDDYTEALKNIELSKQAIGEDNLFSWRIILDTAHAELLFWTGDYQHSLEFADRTIDTVDGFPNYGVFVHALMIKTLLKAKTGEMDTAFQCLKKAILLIKQHKINRYTNWYPALVSTVAQFAFRYDIESEIMKNWIALHINYLPAPSPAVTEWPWPVQVFTLGRFEVLVNGRAIFAETRRNARPIQLLKCIIKHHGHVLISTLNDELYPDMPADKQQNSLHTHLHRLRQLLLSDEIILRESDKLCLSKNHCWSDDSAFSALLVTKTDIAENNANRQQALALYKGEYLKSENDDFDILTRREHLRGLYLNAITEEIQANLQQPNIAIELCHQAIKIEPLSESLYQTLIQIYLRQGRRDLANTTYDQCRRILLSHLDIEPSAPTSKLLEN